MWHEARRQEKKIRGLMVDLKRRADRRREFYEKIKQDPTQFLRMYGRPVKIHLDPAVSMAAEGPQSMMAWQGDSTNMIDRFDVRANLDCITEYNPNRSSSSTMNAHEQEERLANYERYRTLVENEASGLSEEQCLHQIYLDEHFGTINKPNEEEKKKNADKKAAIGYVYEDSTPVEKKEPNEDSEEESDEDLDMADLDVTIDVDSLTPDMCKEVNAVAGQYGMVDDDFVRLLRKDKEELEALKEARQLEEAKAQFSGRKSRRERRAINEKRQNPQRFCRPSYAARDSPKYEPYKRPGSSSRSRSRSRSRSSERAEVKFITSFGGNDSDDETGGGIVQGPSLPTSTTPNALFSQKKMSESSKCETPWLSGSSPKRESKHESSRRRQSSRSSTSRSRSRTRSRSRSSLRHRVRWSRGRSNSRRRSSSSSSRSRSRSMSRSESAKRDSKRSRSNSVDKLPVKRYRRESLSSSSGLSGLESDDDNDKLSLSSSSKNKAGEDKKINMKTGGKFNSKSYSQSAKETPQERLKRRMQAQLNKQYKADKKAEISRITKQEQERLDREEEIRNLAIEMRRRERERRHREREEEEIERRSKRRKRHDSSSSNSSSRDSSLSRSRSRSSSPSSQSKRKRKSSDSDNSDHQSNKRRTDSAGDRVDRDRTKRKDEDKKRLDRLSDGGRKRDQDEWDSSRKESSGSRREEMEDIDGRPWDDGDSSSSSSRRYSSGGGGSSNYGRDNRQSGWRQDRDRDDRGYRSSGSRWQSRAEPPSSQNRRRALLHRPDSPPPPLMSRGRYYPRN